MTTLNLPLGAVLPTPRWHCRADKVPRPRPQAVIVEATKPPERGMAWSAQMERKAGES
jgi:hypothetical protein